MSSRVSAGHLTPDDFRAFLVSEQAGGGCCCGGGGGGKALLVAA